MSAALGPAMAALVAIEAAASTCTAALCLAALSGSLQRPLRWIEGAIVVAVAEGAVVTAVTGVSPWTIQPLASFVVLVALSVIADPGLRAERLGAEGPAGTSAAITLAGPRETGVRLNFFRLFWVFSLWCFLGFVLEEVWWVAVVEPGTFQNRAGLLFGPFSPIYGLGSTLLTVVLNRFSRAGARAVFLASAVCGCVFEVAAGLYMQSGYGAVSWDYSDATVLGLLPDPLSQLTGGRTCLLFALIWGLLGLLWIRVMMPRIVGLVDRIPWRLRYAATGLCFALMMANGLMTLQALGCWQARLGGRAPSTPIESFYATQFGNDFMSSRFESMTVTP